MALSAMMFRVICAAALVASVSACGGSEPTQPSTTFYEREIGPILTQSCSKSSTLSGCHVAADDRGNAFGNLNLESYSTLSLRRDLLIPYGPYGVPGLVAKAVSPFQLRLTNWDSTAPVIIRTDIPHAGGALLDVASSSYTQIVRWIERGATENNTPLVDTGLEKTPCSDELGLDPLFDAGVDPSTDDFRAFSDSVNPVLTASCAAGNCHGSAGNSLYLTCGDTPEQVRWNYFVAGDYVSSPADASELLRRALSTQNGGTYHEGGNVFATPDDQGYRAILEWAEAKGGPNHVPEEPGFRFFADRVQPMLVKKGCMLLGCHSPAMGHDYRLRGGSGGHFGLPATRTNYELSLDQLALESPDANASRLLAKNLVPAIVGGIERPAEPKGIAHRGGALFGRGRDDCDLEAAQTGPLDEQDPYCVIRAWFELERSERMAGAVEFTSIVYVRRPVASERDFPQDFETFRPGGDVLRAPASYDVENRLVVGVGASLLPLCGLGAGVDVRRPAVSWDGHRIAFSARSAVAEPWRIYVVDEDTCAVEAAIDAAPTDENGELVPDNGELVHNFDPTFSPDGRIVFASTRGNTKNRAAFDYDGPQRTPADPSKLNANLYVLEDGVVRQLTFLPNQEMTPSFMCDGRLIMVSEKRAPGFYQLAGRRQNLDGGDYHPLFGQRSTIGFNQLTDLVEIADKTFAAILSDRNAERGGGVLAIVNRSIGIDQRSTDPADYAQDPAASTWQNPEFFQHSLRLLDGVGRPGEAGPVYRSPSPLPDGSVLVSVAQAGDVAAFDTPYEIYVVDPVSGRRDGPVASDAMDLLWPVAVYARAPRKVFRSRIDEPNGASRLSVGENRAELMVLDVPLLSSLVFQNTRSERILPLDGSPFELWESLPPEAGVRSFADGGPFVISDDFGELYVRRRRLGAATPLEDGSVRARVPGGMPLLYAVHARLEGDREAQLHHQREEIQIYPGESLRQGFRRELFNGTCGGCHGSVSGREEDVAVNPDILTRASDVAARTARPVDLTRTTSAPEGPPFP